MAKSARAKYLQIADDLTSQMAGGTLAVGAPLPSTSALARQYQVSPGVVRAAISELSSAGLVEGQPGKAVYVIRLPDEPSGPDRQYRELRAALSELTQVVEGLATRLGELEAKNDL